MQELDEAKGQASQGAETAKQETGAAPPSAAHQALMQRKIQRRAQARQTDKKGGPTATAAEANGPEMKEDFLPSGGGGGAVSGSLSTSFETKESLSGGVDVLVSETITAQVKVGEGTYTFNVSKEGLDVDNGQFAVSLGAPSSLQGKRPGVTGGEMATSDVELAGGLESKSGVQQQDGYTGRFYETSWTVKFPGNGHLKPWQVTVSLRGFIGVKVKPKSKPWYDDIPVVSPVVAAVAAGLAAAIGAIVATSPEWGPVVEGLAIAA